MKDALIIFVRNPEKGKVKTRLAAGVGDEMALGIYIKLLEHTKSVASAVNCDGYVFTSEPLTDDRWKNFQTEPQKGNDLGQRMNNAFDALFKKGYSKVIIIGSDCPGLLPAHIEEAFKQLNSHDIVFGPAIDGGYYLLAMKKPYPVLFGLAAWSTGTVLSESMDIIRRMKLSCFLLEALNDVDEQKDIPQNW